MLPCDAVMLQSFVQVEEFTETPANGVLMNSVGDEWRFGLALGQKSNRSKSPRRYRDADLYEIDSVGGSGHGVIRYLRRENGCRIDDSFEMRWTTLIVRIRAIR